MGTEYTLYKVHKPEYYDLGKHLFNLDRGALLNSDGLKASQSTEKWNRKPFNLRRSWESFAAFYDFVLMHEVSPDNGETILVAAKALWDWAKNDDLILVSDDEDSKAMQAHYLQTSGHNLNCGGQFLI